MLRILSAHAEIEICSTADAAEKANGCADHTEWERYVGRSVSEHADAVTDKELIYHVIEGADEHRDDARIAKRRKRVLTGSEPRGFSEGFIEGISFQME